MTPPEASAGFTKQGRAVIAILGGICAVVSATVLGLSALGLLHTGEARADTVSVSTSDRLDTISRDIGEIKADVKAYLVRVDVLERWRARQEGAEEQRNRDERERRK